MTYTLMRISKGHWGSYTPITILAVKNFLPRFQ